MCEKKNRTLKKNKNEKGPSRKEERERERRKKRTNKQTNKMIGRKRK
jgi:hypothetical protein